MLLAGSQTAPAGQGVRAGAGRAGRFSRALGWVLLVLLGFLLVEVLFEAWVQVQLADRGGIDANGNRLVQLPDWPKTLKNGIFLTLLALSAAKVAADRSWREFCTRVDLALAVLAVALVLAGLVNDSSPRLIGEAAYVYLRGAIVFYAWRAADPSWRRIRAVLAMVAAVVAVDTVIAIAQTIIGYDSYQALGWVNLSWARINRAHALLDHPNHLGHLLSVALLGLLAWFVTRPATQAGRGRARLRQTPAPGAPARWPWWAAYAALALALSATQSRESLIGFVAGAAVIGVLRRGGWPVARTVAAALVLVVGFAAAQVAFSPSNRSELQRRLAGVFSAFNVGSGDEGDDFCVKGNADCADGDPNQIPQREVRVLYAQQGAGLWAHRPLLGYGVGQFGGIVASENDPNWFADSRFGPHGFNMYGFQAQQVDSFWLHLLVETGTIGSLAYLTWLGLLVAPFVALAVRRRDPGGPGGRAPPAPLHPVAYWVPATLVFAALIAFFASSLEDPIFPALLFTVFGVGWVLLRRGELSVPERTTPETAAPDKAAPEKTGWEKSTLDQTALDQTAPGMTALEKARPDHLRSDQFRSDQPWSESSSPDLTRTKQ